MTAAPLRVLVCGGRKYGDSLAVTRTLDGIAATEGLALLIEGGAMGADRLAAYWAEARGMPCVRMSALWSAYGKQAGPIRNGWMIALLQPDIVVAFPGGTGTADCVRQARAAGIPVRKAAPTTPAPALESGARP